VLHCVAASVTTCPVSVPRPVPPSVFSTKHAVMATPQHTREDVVFDLNRRFLRPPSHTSDVGAAGVVLHGLDRRLHNASSGWLRADLPPSFTLSASLVNVHLSFGYSGNHNFLPTSARCNLSPCPVSLDQIHDTFKIRISAFLLTHSPIAMQ